MKYKLIADSSCDVTDSMNENLDITLIPFFMTVGDKSFIDDKSLNITAFLDAMKNYKQKGISACPSPEAYMKELVKGATNFIITISSCLSGSYQSAMIAKGIDEETDVHVFDSKSASAGEILVGLKIKELIDLGLEKTHIIEKVEAFIKNMQTIFVLEDLDNLVKNGRMSKITSTLATVLQMRPILGSKDGEIIAINKARGTTAAVEKIVNLIGDYCSNTAERVLVITHCNNLANANMLKDLATKLYSFKDIIVAPTKGLSTMYANDGGIIIAF